MRKTTLYLPDELKAAVERVARARGQSEAEVMRDAIGRLTADLDAPRPRLPLFASGDPILAHEVDDLLAGGFGRE